jgi:hypothetical protein
MSFDQLPRQAALRFTEMREAVEEAQTRMLSTRRRIKSYEDQRKNVNDKTTIAEITEEIGRLSSICAAQGRDFEQRSRLATAINMFVVGLPRGIQLEPHKRLVIRDEYKNAESIENAVADLREKLVELKAQLQRAQRAIPKIEEAYREADTRAAALVERGRPQLGIPDGKSLTIKFATESKFGSGIANDAVAVLAWLDPERMRARLRAEVDALYGRFAKTNTPILSADERVQTIQSLRDDILQCERNEENAIAVAEEMSLFIPRREDADPLAVLSIEIVKRQRAVA